MTPRPTFFALRVSKARTPGVPLPQRLCRHVGRSPPDTTFGPFFAPTDNLAAATHYASEEEAGAAFENRGPVGVEVEVIPFYTGPATRSVKGRPWIRST